MAAHPYVGLPDHAFWKRSVAEVAPDAVDPMIGTTFRIPRTARIATFGSCFAQHLSRRLAAGGCPTLATETAHPLIAEVTPPEYNYGVYTARTGNIYTTRQLLQLLQRALGQFEPVEAPWRRPDGFWADPFRPEIQPEGFTTLAELRQDRAHHLACVRTAFETLDVLVFTLGLTEGWEALADGAVFPLAPGVVAGTFDPACHRFRNARVSEILADLSAVLDLLLTVNPTARLLLTVSPVPLIATAEPQHVLVSTSYSKAVLRAACGELAATRADVGYFPSYEIITGSFNRGRYFAPDLRSITEAGVDHVMRVFERHVLTGDPAVPAPAGPPSGASLATLVQTICEEEAIGR